jgi:hypothetical protein
MNTRIEELINQCYVFVEGDGIDRDTTTYEDHVVFDKEKFAELIVLELSEMVLEVAPQGIALQIIDKLCDRLGVE